MILCAYRALGGDAVYLGVAVSAPEAPDGGGVGAERAAVQRHGELGAAQQGVQTMLQEINSEVSALLGINFASLARRCGSGRSVDCRSSAAESIHGQQREHA